MVAWCLISFLKGDQFRVKLANPIFFQNMIHSSEWVSSKSSEGIIQFLDQYSWNFTCRTSHCDQPNSSRSARTIVKGLIKGLVDEVCGHWSFGSMAPENAKHCMGKLISQSNEKWNYWPGMNRIYVFMIRFSNGSEIQLQHRMVENHTIFE